LEPYRYQQLAYLLVPVILGAEFFLTAKDERKGRGEPSLGPFVLDFFGMLFMAILPAIVIFTIWAKNSQMFSDEFLWKDTLERLDRYGVTFFFLGAWWQVHIISALRARRLKGEGRRLHVLVLGPFLALGLFVSFLVLCVSPFGLKWISVGLFVFVSSVLYVFRARPKTMEKVFWGMAAVTFFFMNVLFVWLDAVV
jgi:hypothetical protein